MADFRPLVPNIRALQRKLGCDYSHLFWVLKGEQYPSRSLAKRIESATGGAIRAVWLLGLEDPPPHHSSESEAA